MNMIVRPNHQPPLNKQQRLALLQQEQKLLEAEINEAAKQEQYLINNIQPNKDIIKKYIDVTEAYYQNRLAEIECLPPRHQAKNLMYLGPNPVKVTKSLYNIIELQQKQIEKLYKIISSDKSKNAPTAVATAIPTAIATAIPTTCGADPNLSNLPVKTYYRDK